MHQFMYLNMLTCGIQMGEFAILTNIMKLSFSRTNALLSSAFILCSGVAVSQVGEHDASKTGEADLKTSIGSFKILKRGDVLPSGKIRMSFKGTVLVVGLKKDAKFSIAGNVRKEYENAQRGRICYHGQGTITMDGTFESIQWFGRDLNMNWIGQGVCRVYGEFDSKGDTGTFTYKGDKPKFWGNGGMTYVLPVPSYMNGAAKPKINRSGG
jgi:hypothetical protein